MTTQERDYASILSTLLPKTSPISSSESSPTLPLPLCPSSTHTLSPLFPDLTSRIARLQLHPSLEAALHILNNDLPAAHFLVRHMQDVVPRDEGERRERNRTEGDDQDRESRSCEPKITWAQRAGGGSTADTANSTTKGAQSESHDAANNQPTRQTPPKIEGLLLHALLHRIEGDYENARAWYGIVDAASAAHRPFPAPESSSEKSDDPPEEYTDAWVSTHPTGLAPLNAILDRIIALRAKIHPLPSPPRVFPAGATDAQRVEHEELEAWHRGECERVARWCESRYGIGVWEEGSMEFVGMPRKHREIAGRMVTGGEGWRQF